MFATQFCDPIAHKWPLETFSPSVTTLSRPRMSDPYGIGSSTKPSWAEDGLYLQRTESSQPQQLFPTSQDSSHDRGHTDGVDDIHANPSHLPFSDFQGYGHSYDHGSRFRTRTSPSAPSIMTEGVNYRSNPAGSDQFWRSRPDQRGDFGLVGHHNLATPGSSSQASLGRGHGELEEYSDEGDVVEGDSEGLQQTVAERLASRRKMKRFRLTHQQTRFLMSEFAKQPHPDAAHRDRLSREIPGLSPRQVQVWFQNRRAKIKRLNADDRERVVQMRAVPENFDNIQALHSPYGAVPAYDGSIPQTATHGQHMYAPHHTRPLLVDVRRTEGENPMQSTGLTPIFGGIGFNSGHVPGMLDANNPILSSPSAFGSDRYTYGSRPGPGVPDPKGSSANSPVNEGERAGPRPIRPAGLTDPMARGRSASLQSTVGSSMYWRGGGLGDVAEVQDIASEHGSEGQPPSLHTSTSGMGLNTLFYGGDTSTQSSSGTGDMTPMHQGGFRRSRAASASYALDGRGQYGEANQQHVMPSPMRTDATQPTAPGQAPAYNPGYTASPAFPGSMSLPTTERDHMAQFAYSSGGTSSAVEPFPMATQTAGEDMAKPFFQGTTPPVHFQRQDEVAPYQEAADETKEIKRE